MAANEIFETYRTWLGAAVDAGIESDKNFVVESFMDAIMRSPAYHSDALCNGEPTPIVASRTEMKKCNITVIPGSVVNVGDIIEVFNEHWLCVSLYKDEYGMSYGQLWLCNVKLSYQGFDLKIINKYAVLDDGSYSKGNDTSIPVESNYYNCYISLDTESDALTVDKRLALDKMYDINGNIILDVGKIAWVDKTSNNYGSGSHLLVFGLKDDVYNASADNTSLMICDYKAPQQIIDYGASNTRYLSILGKDTIKIGTTRKYSAIAVDSSGNTVYISTGLQWSIPNIPNGVSITTDNAECVIKIQLSGDLIGQSFTIRCVDTSGVYAAAEKEVVVKQVG